MKAMVLEQYMKLEMTDMPVPEIGPNDVLVRVRACGICGSDVHGMDGSTGRRIPPIVMGHEGSGEVAATGTSVREFREGDRVTFDSTIYCGRCYYCGRGDWNLCDNREVLGVSPGEYRRHGAFAEYVAVPSHIVYKLPDSFRFEHAAVIEAVSVAVHAVRITPVQLGDTAVVVGSGMIGLLAIQALRSAGCATVIAIDVDDLKLKIARGLGATHALNGGGAGVSEAVRDLTRGRGADVAIECVGAPDPIRTAIGSVRKGGAVTLVGNVSPSADLPLQAVVSRQIRLQGSCASNGEFPICIDLISRGAIQVEPLISAVAPLTEGPAWFDRLYRHEPNLMKVVLQP
jgi:L-iditol 2-dehydrogenase